MRPRLSGRRFGPFAPSGSAEAESAHRRPSRRRLRVGVAISGRRARGFTLIELVVVFTIIAGLMAVVPIAFSKLRDVAEYRGAVRDVVSTFRKARSQAATSGQAVLVTIDVDGHQYGIGTATEKRVPATLTMRLTTAKTEIGAEGKGSIRFYPDGSSTGGSVELLRASGEGTQVRVDWLLGRISQHPAVHE